MTPKPPSRVNWVHPSVRDVVIDYLSAHDNDRLRYLRTAPVAGIVLAMSSAGGAAGTRANPLLRSANDRKTVVQRASEIGRAGTERDRLALLRALVSANLSGATDGPPRQDILDASRHALSGILEAWSRDGFVVRREALASYYELGIRARMYMPSPPLLATWDAYWHAFKNFVDDWDADDETLEPVSAWCELAVLLDRNEPRFLRIVGFPEAHEEVLDELLAQVHATVEAMDELDPDETEDYETEDPNHTYVGPATPGASEAWEEEWLEKAIPILESLEMLVSGKRAQTAEALRDRAVDRLHERTQRREHYREFVEPERDDWHDERPPRGSDFDIDEFFEDL